jgi:hypothetical protein
MLPCLLAAALVSTGAVLPAASSSTAAVAATDSGTATGLPAAERAIMADLSLNFPAPPFGEVSAAYSDTLAASGGTAPYTWTVSSGSLPGGITLDSATGTLSGTPTTAGSSTFTIQVTDADSQSATQETFLAIVPRTALSFPDPPAGQLGTGYSDKLVAAGGKPPYAWTVTAGDLPAGITLDSASGTLSGTPTAAGTFTFTVQATDANDQSATKATSLVIAPATALTTSAATVNFGTRDVLTATMTPAEATGSVTFSDVPSRGPQAGESLTLGTATLSGGTASLAAALPAFATNTVTATYRGSPAFAVDTSPATAVQVNAYSGEVLISEFRLSGPGGAADQYAELYNTGAAVPLAGFTLTASSGAAETIPDSAPTLPNGHGYLITGSDYSLTAVAAPDQTTASLGTAGLQVTAPDQAATVTDAAGTTAAQPGFSAGTPLPALTGTPTDQYAWVRLRKAGLPVSTGSNAADFQLVSTTGGIVGGVQSALGSPAPQATGSPIRARTFMQSALLDSSQGTTSPPNFVYQAGAPGLLTIRRTITNHSTLTVTAALLRITSLSEVNGPPQPGVTTPPLNVAQFRVINPATPTTQLTITGHQVITVHNLSVDPPATPSPGGGLNTTLTIPLPGGGLAAGASISIALSFAVDRHGPYWFGYDTDATTPLVSIVTGPPGPPDLPGTRTRPIPVRAPYSSQHGRLPRRVITPGRPRGPSHPSQYVGDESR